MFERRHYKKLAEVFKEARPKTYNNLDAHANGEWDMWYNVTNLMAEMLQRDNPKFNKDRFEEACRR